MKTCSPTFLDIVGQEITIGDSVAYAVSGDAILRRGHVVALVETDKGPVVEVTTPLNRYVKIRNLYRLVVVTKFTKASA